YYFNESKHYNCLTKDECPDGYKLITTKNKCIKKCADDNIFGFRYEFNNECYETCPNGHYTNQNGIEVCQCRTNNTCKDCAPEALEKNLCSSCNEHDGFYPKEEESTENLMNCYNNDNKPSNYILISNRYHRCYETCATCTEIGDSSNHKCTNCISGYSQQNNDQNCYLNCDNYFYFKDGNIFTCLDEKKCPTEPTNYKLIESAKKCIEYCKDDDKFNFKFEYDGTCVQSCSEGQYEIEGGQKVCKCMTNTTCKDCPSSGNPNKLCKTCNEGYYPKAIESSNEFKSCYNSDSITKNYVLIGDKYELCYESCAECDDKGTPENHNCKICKTGYSKLNNGKDDNCYPDCNNYYYFNESNHYICLPEKKCPDGYKLIAEKKKCIKNCKDDNIFNYIYEYDGTCVQSCSAGFYTIDTQKVCKCETNPACQDCPSSGNPNKLCKTCNEGYYPKLEESNKNLKQCYNDGNIPSNYIFDSNLYKRCYESCGTCTEIGDSSNHKCGDCASGYKRHDDEDN
ncbi:hypothetical protein II654_01400, partial [bacterium]|nr:hypothetical protein [bacterium]